MRRLVAGVDSSTQSCKLVSATPIPAPGGQVVTELQDRGNACTRWCVYLGCTCLEAAGVEIARGDMVDPAPLLQAEGR